jgi:hypothetical protein
MSYQIINTNINSNAKMGSIDPIKWGFHTWKMMHYLTYNYPNQPSEQNKTDIYNFFISMQNLLPCEKCRVNYAEHLKMHPLTKDILNDRRKLVNWLIDIHNEVNKSLGKRIMTYDEVDRLYLKQPFNYWKIFVPVILLIFVLLYVRFRKMDGN